MNHQRGNVVAGLAVVMVIALAQPGWASTLGRDDLFENHRVDLSPRILDDGTAGMDSIFELVLSAYSAGDFPRTIAIAEPFLELHPRKSHAGLYVFAGTSYGLLGDWSKAEEILRRGMNVWPEDAPLRFNLGVSLAEQGRFAEALDVYEGCLRRAPYEAATWQAMAAVLDRSGMRARAFVAYARAQSLDPDAARAEHTAARMWELLFEGLDAQADAENGGLLKIGIRVPLEGDEPESAARTTEAIGMSLVAALRYEESWRDVSDARFFTFALDQVLMFLSDLDGKGPNDPFWRPMVFAYFDELRDAGHMEALAYDIRRSAGDPEVVHWNREHPREVKLYRDWSDRWAVDWSTVRPETSASLR